MFSKPKHRIFKYNPQFLKENEANSKFEDANLQKPDFISKWEQTRSTKRKVKGAMNFKTIVLLIILLLIAMYILENKFK